MKNVKAVLWFTGGHGCVGIVAVADKAGRMRCYVGLCGGIDPDADSQTVADWGAKFDNPAARKALFPDFDWEAPKENESETKSEQLPPAG